MESSQLIEHLKHLLKRNTVKRNTTKDKHERYGTSRLTYHAGFDAGYLTGKCSVLEDMLLELDPTLDLDELLNAKD